MDTDEKNRHRTYKCVVRFEKKALLPAQFLVGVALGTGLYFSAEWYWLVVACMLFELAGIAVMWWPAIEPERGIVRERALLFGKRQLSERVMPLGEFVEIFYKYNPGDGGDTNYRLGLRHKTGRKLWIEGCWPTRRSVETIAWEISCKTGVKLKEWPV
jgi:hypothetical protein